ncbi:MAG: GAF domain-containing protein, partial [Deltaproteobacteria bacterium]|nr:GAF domain-containing protein [Deltaproteobacteria bacterium]
SIAYAPAGIEGLDWFIEAKKDLNEIRTPLNRLRDQSLLIGLFVAIGVVLANFLFAVGIIKPLRRIREAAHKIASGDFGIRLPVETKGEIGWLSESVNNMAVSLKKSREEIEKYSHSLEEKVEVRTEELNNKNQALGESNYIQRAHNEIVAALNTEIEIESLLKNIISKIARHTDSQLGVIYLYEDEAENLRPVSSYAIDRGLLGEGFALGHGLPGQAGQEKRAILVTEVPDNYFRISSGGIEGMPRNVLCMPITFKDQLMGVLELAGIHDYSEKAIQFLDVAGHQLGIGINNALIHLRLEDMAGDLKEKNEFLAAQNEELQAQGEELRAQAEELQVQAEELMSQKNALEEKTEQVKVSDRLKSEFVSNMSHEFRTPLNVLLGLTNLMAEGNTGAINEKQKEYLESRVRWIYL